MSDSTRCVVWAVIVVAVFSGPLQAQSCKPEQDWRSEHSKSKADTITHDIKGSRATRIEVCRAKEDSGKALDVEVRFEGGQDVRALAEGACHNKLTKWAVIKSHGTQTADGKPAIALGTYKICKD